MATYLTETQCNLAEFKELTSVELPAKDLFYAASVEKNIPIYDMTELAPQLENESQRQHLMSEWSQVLMHSSGVVVLQNACTNLQAIDDASDIFNTIISDEKRLRGEKADHFAATGLNDRIWNTQQKLCEHSPEVYTKYYANPAIDAACEAWLGPGYQMTAQLNVVHPGGAAQKAHRDYHLGFQTAERSALYPAHVHRLSPVLTLQGAIAHVDIPIESGSTKLLPFSQRYTAGYAAWRLDEFREWFEQRYVQLPLKKGDALFFNPAIFHAAGANQSSDIRRMVNLLQVSSAFGRAMENVDRLKMTSLLFPALQKMYETSELSNNELKAIVSSASEGYSFPTNLDLDPPTAGLAPQTQQALVYEALEHKWSLSKLENELHSQYDRQQC